MATTPAKTCVCVREIDSRLFDSRLFGGGCLPIFRCPDWIPFDSFEAQWQLAIGSYCDALLETAQGRLLETPLELARP